ncbi:Na+/H+ antiporter subunit E [Saccharopolyspora flava]|uniref:Multisubunit sodium/proton antiporter, MrpE subunit (TC 2.A.63.1) n=1 Tax=Saccharopolyspora flava TaxID=95161 RepID=A0A1I6PM05_9PSEU|nr:Na+/H+ antiporter subunit E [Saccharopolyspora flava]SFS41118.1 multisubunit sodium/proton antiporter, MrpE subunit (TC 2.A.63.1) [Saccharopolyspora flava]
MGERMTRRRRFVRRLPLVCWLTVVWVLLWGSFDLGTLFFGVLVALLVTSLFPLPMIRTGMVLRPLPLLRLAAYLAWDLVISTIRVAWQAVAHRRGTTAGIVATTLHADSDHLIAIVASAVSLAPGKFVLQIDRAELTCYVYAMGMRPGDEESVRREVRFLERLVVEAVGSTAQRDLVRGSAG